MGVGRYLLVCRLSAGSQLRRRGLNIKYRRPENRAVRHQVPSERPSALATSAPPVPDERFHENAMHGMKPRESSAGFTR